MATYDTSFAVSGLVWPVPNAAFEVAYTAAALDSGSPALVSVYQRVYDSTVGFVYYAASAVNPTPISTATTPNHTNNLVGGTHAVIARF